MLSVQDPRDPRAGPVILTQPRGTAAPEGEATQQQGAGRDSTADSEDSNRSCCCSAPRAWGCVLHIPMSTQLILHYCPHFTDHQAEAWVRK